MAAVRDSTRGERLTICADVRHPSSPANKSLRGSRGPEAGVRGIPSPFINLDERGRDTPHPSLLPLILKRKDFLDEVLDLGEEPHRQAYVRPPCGSSTPWRISQAHASSASSANQAAALPSLKL